MQNLRIPMLGSKSMMSFPTLESAKKIVRENLNIKQNEAVLIVSDSTRPHLADAMSYAVLELDDNCSKTSEKLALVFITPRHSQRKEPPRSVAAAMKATDVIIMPTSISLTFTEATIQAKRNSRIASMPGVTEEMMVNGGLSADYEEVKQLTREVAKVLESTKEFKVTSPNRTDLTFDRGGRPVLADDGDFSKKGKIGNLPAGEACFAIVEDSANGTLVFDRMGYIATSPLKLTIENGKVKRVEGRDKKNLLRILEAQEREGDLDATTVAEFGLGTNPMAKYLECPVEGEKMYGTVHFGIGSNEALPKGKSKSGIHHDGVILDARLELDGRVVVKGRKFYI